MALLERPARRTPGRHDPDEELLGALSYRGLRLGIGLLAFCLPPALVFGQLVLDGEQWPDSISAYYYTSMRNVFVGSLCILAAFLFSYRYRPRDNRLSSLAAVLALGIALVPTAASGRIDGGERWLQVVHLGSAVAFFAVLAWFSLVVFTRNGGVRSPRKVQRDRVYRVCGLTIVGSLLLAGLNGVLDSQVSGYALQDRNALFWCESTAVWAFATAWLVKGGWFLPDARVPVTSA